MPCILAYNLENLNLSLVLLSHQHQQWQIHNNTPQPSTMAHFLPRTTFPAQLSLPRSYFLGHHASGLARMKTMLSSIDLIIECRDYRVPLTSRNPLFEQSLAGRERLVIYTKRDLGSKGRASDRRVRLILPCSLVLFRWFWQCREGS